MPNIFKRFMNPAAVKYVFADASELDTDADTAKPQEDAAEDFTESFGEDLTEAPRDELSEGLGEEEAAAEAAEAQEEAAAPAAEPDTPVTYARVQAEAILAQARLDAEDIREKALKNAENEVQELFLAARTDGYNAGFKEGMTTAMNEAQSEIERQIAAQGAEFKSFLEAATHRRDLILQDLREDLRDLALAVAEKVIRVSLKSSGDILLRMIDNATEKHRRCEWVQIYIADCDTQNIALSTPELTEALGHLSNRIRIIPMANDESGTCIIEMPDEIIDASVSTQMDNIREIIQQNNAGSSGDD